jgi:hypothetical protein
VRNSLGIGQRVSGPSRRTQRGTRLRAPRSARGERDERQDAAEEPRESAASDAAEFAPRLFARASAVRSQAADSSRSPSPLRCERQSARAGMILDRGTGDRKVPRRQVLGHSLSLIA